MRSKLIPGLAVMALALLAGCAQYTDKRGVEVTWDPSTLGDFAVGETTRNDVLASLGPPSQVISLDDETAFYYLFERSGGDGLILVVYNRFRIDTGYDRAIFFFDEEDRLTDYATHIRE